MAVQIAASPDVVHEFLRWAVFGDTPAKPLPPRPPTAEWLAMYRDHRGMQDGIAAGMCLIQDATGSEVLDELRAFASAPPEVRAAEVATWTEAEMRGFLRPFMGVPFPPDDHTLRAMLDELEAEAEPGEPAQESALDSLLASAAGQFYVRVWWSCWVLHRTYPQRLLRAARLGDLEALDKLLRIDKFIVGDPGIARVLGDVMTTGHPNDRKRLNNALAGTPKTKLSPEGLRAGLGALISQLALVFHSRVTAPQIQSLFDAIERVRSGNPADPAIPAGDSWSKAVQRNRSWPSLPKG